MAVAVTRPFGSIPRVVLFDADSYEVESGILTVRIRQQKVASFNCWDDVVTGEFAELDKLLAQDTAPTSA